MNSVLVAYKQPIVTICIVFLTYWWIFVFVCYFWVYTRLAILAIVCPVLCTNCYKQKKKNLQYKYSTQTVSLHVASTESLGGCGVCNKLLQCH